MYTSALFSLSSNPSSIILLRAIVPTIYQLYTVHEIKASFDDLLQKTVNLSERYTKRFLVTSEKSTIFRSWLLREEGLKGEGHSVVGRQEKEMKKGNRNAVIPIVKKSPTKIQ